MKKLNNVSIILLDLFFCLLFFCPLESDCIRLHPFVVSKFPHSNQFFTQGLSIDKDDLYEAVGLYGFSGLIRRDIKTNRILERKFLPKTVFGEGITLFSNEIIQITWKEETAFVYNRPDLQIIGKRFYKGEGWGLCRDHSTIWMSDGTSTLTQRDPTTFEVLKTITVKFNGQPIDKLNDLECVNDELYANVLFEMFILRIDKASGSVTGIIDASHLLTPKEEKALTGQHSLNGIAFSPERGTFFITGKSWPWIFEVKFLPIAP